MITFDFMSCTRMFTELIAESAEDSRQLRRQEHPWLPVSQPIPIRILLADPIHAELLGLARRADIPGQEWNTTHL